MDNDLFFSAITCLTITIVIIIIGSLDHETCSFHIRKLVKLQIDYIILICLSLLKNSHRTGENASEWLRAKLNPHTKKPLKTLKTTQFEKYRNFVWKHFGGGVGVGRGPKAASFLGPPNPDYGPAARSYTFFKELKMIDKTKSMKICTPSMYEWLEPPGTPTEVMGIHQLCRGGLFGTLDS